MSDDLWDIRVHEKQEEDDLRKRISQLDTEITLAKRGMSLRTSPGFNDFVASIEEMRENSVKQMVMDARLTNDGLRETRGYVKALSRVLALLTSTSAADRLEASRSRVQNTLDDALKRRPKPNPQEAQP